MANEIELPDLPVVVSQPTPQGNDTIEVAAYKKDYDARVQASIDNALAAFAQGVQQAIQQATDPGSSPLTLNQRFAAMGTKGVARLKMLRFAVALINQQRPDLKLALQFPSTIDVVENADGSLKAVEK